jgi:hypothetical protein
LTVLATDLIKVNTGWRKFILHFVAGSGVYAIEQTSYGLQIWLFTRSTKIPDDIQEGRLDPTTWGKPMARFHGICDFDGQFFNHLVIYRVGQNVCIFNILTVHHFWRAWAHSKALGCQIYTLKSKSQKVDWNKRYSHFYVFFVLKQKSFFDRKSKRNRQTVTKN